MFSDVIGRGGKFVLDRIVWVLTRLKINPNILTFTGVLISFWAAWEFGFGNFFRGGLVIILAGLFDMLDGEVARVSGTESTFGAFYDSVIDRYSDVIILQGLVVYYARKQMLAICSACRCRYYGIRADQLCPGPRRISDSKMQSRIHGKA